MSMTENEFREYRDYMVSVHAAKDNWDTMRDEARAEGLAEGFAEGTEKGILSVARKLKSMGLSVADIVKATGLTEDEIHSL